MESKQFIEIVNWEKAQPLMKGENNPWYKQYTSTLDNEQVIQLDDTAYRLLTSLWALAARMGTNVLPAYAKWLKRHIPYLQEHDIEPDLIPLMEARDMYGNVKPFIRYCDAPGQEQTTDNRQQTSEPLNASRSALDPLYEKVVAFAGANEYISARALSDKFKIAWKRANNIVKAMQDKGLVGGFVKGKGFVVCARAQSEESREEQKRDTLTGIGREEKKINPNGFKKNPTAEAQRQRQALLQAQAQDDAQKPVSPKKPDEPDELAVASHDRRTQPATSFRGGQAQSLGRIIKCDFKLHWDDAECVEFAEDVLGELGVTAKDDEVGAFANWLFRLKNACGSRVVIDEIKSKMIDKAKSVRKIKLKKNPSALLLYFMDKELKNRSIHLPDVRASPGM